MIPAERANVAVPPVYCDGVQAAACDDIDALVSECLEALREVGIGPSGCWPHSTAAPTVPAR